MTTILDGKKTAKAADEEFAQRIKQLKKQGITPGLAVILVGDDPASKTYIRIKKRRAEKIGINYQLHNLPVDTSEADLLKLIEQLNRDPKIDGFFVQMPLPQQIDANNIINAIDPKKDVDGFSPKNVGYLWIGEDGNTPATPSGILHMLHKYNVQIDGKNAVVIGRSNIVGKPMAAMLLRENATVTICHSHTKNLKEIAKQADILVVAMGKAKFVTKDFIKPGAVVIDVGMDRDENDKLCGDVDFDNVKDIAGMITPVPGGVGPMTITGLLGRVVELAEKRAKD